VASIALNLMTQIASGKVLDEAYTNLCARRKISGAEDGIWSVTLNWPSIRQTLRHKLLAGGYHLSPLELITLKEGNTVSR